MPSNGVLNSNSIPPRIVVWLARACVVRMMGLVCVILGSFVGISRLVALNLCWLKKQKNILEPDRRDSGNQVVWTSGLVYGKGEGIIGMKTDHGTVHIKPLPDCAPHSAFYILELLKARHCLGCKIYRAEGRGRSWDSKGNHINHASYGPTFALIQGTLEAQGVIFKDIPAEACPRVRRGSVAWIGSGPHFFISLANHDEWRNAYTVFGFVLPEDMEFVEKIAELPTKAETWNNNFQRLEKSISDTNRNVAY